ncbi:MAG TPA: EAL domain-containing protein [Thermoanaerobaculia bacterium]|jgi:diguanylate cyclase (GGDEF)-like protein/PAS domain S-box-containing protein|nr:EAL domain-containing protein [Thermoanaerobaculia bacterium]
MPDNNPHPLHLVGGGRDASNAETELHRLRAEIEARNRQETAIAELGQAALTGVEPLIILGQACALLEITLGVDHARALEIRDGRVFVAASIGSNATFVNCNQDNEENESIAMYAAVAGAPVVFEDIEHETRFKSSHLRNFHGVRGGAAVVIPTASGVFGVLVAYSSVQRTFADYEVAFLKSAANLLGEAVERSNTEQALRKSESRLKQLIASTLDVVFTIDRGGIVIEWNPQAEATFGFRANAVVGRPLPPDLRELFDSALASTTRRLETTGRRANGEEFPVEVTIDRVGRGDDQTFTAFLRDISERKRSQLELENREQRFRALVEKSWSGVALLSADLAFCYTGASTERLLGYTEDDLAGTSFLGYVHPREREILREVLGALAAGSSNESHAELRFRHRSGIWIWLEAFAQNLLHEPSVGAIVLNYRDVTQRKATEKQLEYQAYYDALTGLPNRLLFRDRVVNAIAQAQRNRRGVAVMYLDLDHFKLVNDGLGHSLGDALLSEVAARLQSCVRASDTISRLGGDEFTILLIDTSSSEAIAGVARKILQSFAHPFRVEGHDLFVTASIGISIFPGDGEEVETLLKCADSAMYRAKELGRNQAQMFTASMNERYGRRLALEQSLHHALERDELVLHYQPIFDRNRKKIVALEALVRWNHPERGLVQPTEFIGLAEETGLIVAIGEWVLRRVCHDSRAWRAAGLPPMRIGVNISAPQFQQLSFALVVGSILREYGCDPALLELEITETVAVQNIETTTIAMRELKELGIRIAIDDFGTGQSSLVYLKRFPIDTVKIDRAFVRDVTTDESAAAIVSYVINLAHSLRLAVVAEGVETDEQWSFLKLNACDQMQGFLFSEPMPADEAEEFMRSEQAKYSSRETPRP